MVNGIVNVYKEKGYTSFDVVAKLRGIFHQKKIGQTVQVHLILMRKASFLSALERQPECVTF